MSQQVVAPDRKPVAKDVCSWRKIVSLDNRFIPPIFITLILLVGTSPTEFWKAGRRRFWLSLSACSRRWFSEEYSWANGLTLPVHTSLESVSAFYCGRQLFGRLHFAASYPLLRSMSCAGRITTFGTLLTLAFLFSCSWREIPWQASASNGETSFRP